jgi:hypothetical protein
MITLQRTDSLNYSMQPITLEAVKLHSAPHPRSALAPKCVSPVRIAHAAGCWLIKVSACWLQVCSCLGQPEALHCLRCCRSHVLPHL